MYLEDPPQIRIKSFFKVTVPRVGCSIPQAFELSMWIRPFMLGRMSGILDIKLNAIFALVVNQAISKPI